MDYTRTLVLACATVIEEMEPLMPPGMPHEVFDFGLHVNPGELRSTLQEAINRVGDEIDTIILGYGLCSMAVIGIKAERQTLVVPRVDDCISIFLGSRGAYQQQAHAEPGTYYLTKGWIEVGDTPFSDYEHMVERYGPQRAERIMKIMLANYTRVALIDTGQYALDYYRDYARRTAARFNLRFEEIPGSNDLVRKMIFGPWDDAFVVAPPGEMISYGMFFPGE